MQDVREIYAETLAKLELVRSRLITELQELDYIMENELYDSYGERLSPTSEIEVINNLNADISDVNKDKRIVETQIKFLEEFLASTA